MSMHDIVTEVKSLKEVAARDPVNYGATGPAIAVAARQAVERIEELSKEYLELLHRGAVVIFLSSPEDPKEFSQIASDDFGALTVDASELYQKLASAVHPSMNPNTREFNSHQAGQLVAALREVGIDLGMIYMTAPSHTILPVVLWTEQEVVDYVRGVIRQAVGDDLNRSYLDRQILKKALDAGYENPAVPILIVGATEEERTGLAKLFERPVEVVSVTGPITKEVVTKHFTSIKNKLRSQKNK